MVRLQRLTGMRPQEVILMRGADIDRSDAECWAYRPAGTSPSITSAPGAAPLDVLPGIRSE